MAAAAAAHILFSSCGIDCVCSVCPLCFPGGHTSEILRLMECLSAAYTPRHYVIADTDRMSEEKICTFESSKQLGESQVCSHPKAYIWVWYRHVPTNVKVVLTYLNFSFKQPNQKVGYFHEKPKSKIMGIPNLMIWQPTLLGIVGQLQLIGDE